MPVSSLIYYYIAARQPRGCRQIIDLRHSCRGSPPTPVTPFVRNKHHIPRAYLQCNVEDPAIDLALPCFSSRRVRLPGGPKEKQETLATFGFNTNSLHYTSTVCYIIYLPVCHIISTFWSNRLSPIYTVTCATTAVCIEMPLPQPSALLAAKDGKEG